MCALFNGWTLRLDRLEKLIWPRLNEMSFNMDDRKYVLFLTAPSLSFSSRTFKMTPTHALSLSLLFRNERKRERVRRGGQEDVCDASLIVSNKPSGFHIGDESDIIMVTIIHL